MGLNTIRLGMSGAAQTQGLGKEQTFVESVGVPCPGTRVPEPH